VLPLVFTLLLGIIWFGRAFNIYSTIQQAAQQGAITAARNSCATTCGNATAPNGTVTSCPQTGPAGSVAYVIATVMCASSVDPTQIIANSPSAVSCVNPPNPATCTNASNITVCSQVLLNSPTSATQLPQCGVVVGFQYPYQFYLPFTSINMTQITLSAQAQSRMEN
jgi:Flp pilus assembly protein TadG